MKEIYFSEPLYTTKTSFDRFANLQQDIVTSKSENIKITFDMQKRTGLTFVFLISTLPLLAKSKNKKVEIYCNQKIIDLIKKVGGLSKKNLAIDMSTNIAEMLLTDVRIIRTPEDIFKLVPEVVKEAPVKMNDKLTDIFTSKIGEMYNNALEHSKSDFIVGEKYFKYQRNLFCFSCYDGGCGIPQNVIKYAQSTGTTLLNHQGAFRWALAKGNSTANANRTIPRGLGLQLLQSFAKLNSGVIRIVSGNILYKYDNKGEKYYQMQHEFIGTLFEMDIVADNQKEYIIK